MDYIQIGGEKLVINMDAMSKNIVIDSDTKEKCKEESTTTENFNQDGGLIGITRTTNKYSNERQVDSTKYEVVRLMIEILLTYESTIDDSLGFERGMNSLPINIKLAINSLMKYGILTTEK